MNGSQSPLISIASPGLMRGMGAGLNHNLIKDFDPRTPTINPSKKPLGSDGSGTAG